MAFSIVKPLTVTLDASTWTPLARPVASMVALRPVRVRALFTVTSSW